MDQRVNLLLIKHLVGKSNRIFANMPAVFCMLSGIDASHKIVERLYLDDEVIMAIHTAFAYDEEKRHNKIGCHRQWDWIFRDSEAEL